MDRIPLGARFSAPVQTGHGAHQASCTMGTNSFPGIKPPRRGVNRQPHLPPRLKKECSCTSIPLSVPSWQVIGLNLLFLLLLQGQQAVLTKTKKKYIFLFLVLRIRNRSVNLVNDQRIVFRFPAGARDYSFLQIVQTGSDVLPVDSSMGTGDASDGNRVAGAWSWPHTFTVADVKHGWRYTSAPQWSFMSCTGNTF